MRAVTVRAGWFWYEFNGYLGNIDVVSDHDAGYEFLTDSGQSGAIDLKKCRIEQNADNEAVDFDDGTGATSLRNVSITGDPVTMADRELDTKNLCLRQTGADRDGVALADVTGTIDNTMIAVTGEAIVTDDDSDDVVRNRRDDGGCPPAQCQHSAEQ